MFFTIKLYTQYYTELFEIELIIYIKMDWALNNLQRFICHKAQPTNTKFFSVIYLRIKSINNRIVFINFHGCISGV